MKLPTNQISRNMELGRPALGVYVRLGDPKIINLASRAGLRFVRIDAYHGNMGVALIGEMIMSAYANGLTPAVRIKPTFESMREVLELGALSVTLPNAASPRETARLTDAAHYAPRGTRVAARPSFAIGEAEENYFRWAETEILVSTQIESLEAVDALDEYLSIDTLDMIQCGRNDLAVSLGLPGQGDSAQVLDLQKRIVDRALAAGKLVSVNLAPGDTGTQIEYWARAGVQCLTIGGDWQLLHKAFQGLVPEATRAA